MVPKEQRPEHEGDNNDAANISAIIFVIVLIVFSIWLFNKLTSANDKLNCIASGRTNCADLSR
jgi:flagellar biogenesis protein FliO